MRPALAMTVMVAIAGAGGLASAGGPAARMDELQIDALAKMARAVNAGDAHGYAMIYAPDAVITIQGGDALQGRAAIEAYEVGLLREYPGARLGFGSVWQKGMTAVVRYAVSGSAPGGKTMGHEGLLFYRFLPSGKIAEERRYLDSLTPMAQLGVLGAVPPRALPAIPDKPKGHVAASAVATRMETLNVARVRATMAALDAKDEAAFLSAFADDVVLDEMIEPQAIAGMPAVKAWFQSRTAAVADGKTEIMTALGVGDAVLVEAVARGTLNGRLGPVSAAGKPFTVHQAAIVQLREGRIGRITTFMNGKELAQAVGRWPPAAVK
jgi:ketosteroid isomerase-like protein